MADLIDLDQKRKEKTDKAALSIFCGLYWRFCCEEDLTIVIYPGGFEELKEEKNTIDDAGPNEILPQALKLLGKIEKSLKGGIEFKITKQEFWEIIKKCQDYKN